jgi:hypothetical protein
MIFDAAVALQSAYVGVSEKRLPANSSVKRLLVLLPRQTREKQRYRRDQPMSEPKRDLPSAA